MAKVAIIGCAIDYSWDSIKLWAESIKRSGFDGDVIVLCSGLPPQTVDTLTEHGIKCVMYTGSNYMAPHVLRFFFLWHYLSGLEAHYDWIITTDIRDVVFQTNPVHLLDKATARGTELLLSSEEMLYKDEPWGTQNFIDCFGGMWYGTIKDEIINNVGIVAGTPKVVGELSLMVFQMSIGRPTKVVDQAVYNYILKYFNNWKYDNFVEGENWSINLGTTIHAVESISGEIGVTYGISEEKKAEYKKAYIGEQPVITEDGVVCDAHGKPYCVVHQYDRVIGLQPKIEKRLLESG